MHRHNWKSSWMTVLIVTGLSALSLAQDAPAARRPAGAYRGGMGFAATLEKRVGLTPEQRDSVRGLLAEQRQKVAAIHEETDQKIRAILNPDQQQKFNEVLAEQKARFGRRSQGA